MITTLLISYTPIQNVFGVKKKKKEALRLGKKKKKKGYVVSKLYLTSENVFICLNFGICFGLIEL